MVVVFLLQATVDAGRLFQFQGGDDANGGAIISLPSENNKADDRCVRMHNNDRRHNAMNFVLLHA
jgi:hypothetical protein